MMWPLKSNVRSYSSRSVGVLLRLVLALAVIGLFCSGAPVAYADEPPRIQEFEVEPKTHTSVEFKGSFETTGTSEIEWRLEYSTSNTGPWTSACNGFLPPLDAFVGVDCAVGGLSPEVTYFFRFTGSGAGGSTERVKQGETVPLAPETEGLGVSGPSGDEEQLEGSVVANGFETNWHFEYAPAESNGSPPAGESPSWKLIGSAQGTVSRTEAESARTTSVKAKLALSGLLPEAAYYVRLNAESDPEWLPGSGEHRQERARIRQVQGFETIGKPKASTFPFHAVVGEGIRTFGEVGPEGLDTHFAMQYVPQRQYEESGWAEALETPSTDAGATQIEEKQITPSHDEEVNGHMVKMYITFLAAFKASIVGVELPGLGGGEAYRFRLRADNERGVTEGQEATLKTPSPAPSSRAASCPNEAFRTGPSADLPDCRAYEQLTPVEKGTAMDIFPYHRPVGDSALVAEGGEGLIYDGGDTKWEPSPSAVEGFYAFSRTGEGWLMKSITRQPEAAVDFYKPTLFDSNLSQVGLAVRKRPPSGPESEVFETGPPGGPYTEVVRAPASPPGPATRWAAASADFTKLVLQTEDSALMGHSTGTGGSLPGTDLYEWHEGRLSQMNVGANANTIGTCGAVMVGYEGLEVKSASHLSNSSALSDPRGLHALFYAFPQGCPNETELASGWGNKFYLYIRVEGQETVEVGAYKLIADDAEGSKLLLEHNGEYCLYDVQVRACTPVAPSELANAYETLRQTPPGGDRFEYAAGSQFLNSEGGVSELSLPDKPKGVMLPVPGARGQVWRYDRANEEIMCVSCASPFDPEPKLRAQFVQDEFTIEPTVNDVPNPTTVSADGKYVFFETASALVSQDVNGEIPVNGENRLLYNNSSPSVDIYEWRANGVNGCARIQGCLALITNGIDGHHNVLLGAAYEGRDVFFASYSKLVPQDNAIEGNIFDARIGGGFPVSPPPLPPCKGDACFHPTAEPLDTSPASMSFVGPESGPAVMPKRPPKVESKRKNKLCRSRVCRRRTGRARRHHARKKIIRRGHARGRGGRK